MKYRGITVGHM